MMIKLGFASLLSLTLGFAVTTPGCDTADRIYDCTSICNKYKDCADADYDVSECVSSCEDQASESEAFEDQADECQACIDDRSCVGSVFNCADECIGIVP